MSRLIFLDSTQLGDATHPDRRDPIVDWIEDVTAAGTRIGVSELADYEVRRELVRLGKTRGLKRLDEFATQHVYYVITTKTMRTAADLWARARKLGRPGADDKSLDGDMILAAHGVLARSDGFEVLLATSNPKHFSLFVDARAWSDIPVK